MILQLILACSKDPTDDTGDQDPPAIAPTWDAEAAELVCPADAPAPLLDAALLDAGLSRELVAYDDASWQGASYADVLDDPFVLPWFRALHWDALRIPCAARQLAADLDHAAASAHPVATALGEAMARLAEPVEAAPIDPSTAVQTLADLSDLPPDLAAALTPILAAIEAVGVARDRMSETAPAPEDDLVSYGHGGVLVGYDSAPDLTDSAVQDWILGRTGPRRLYDPARVLAFAVEEADLGQFAGLDVTFSATTPRGQIVIAGPGDDAPGDIGNAAFYLDLGGNDTYVHPAAASNRRVPAAVHVDLGGD
ncbi:MAG: hypothetical protein H0V89_13505, partial [Deltaproteobacteria bacterium]|nr:hypothetical protein [Deltaproteobacteria bacterium]